MEQIEHYEINQIIRTGYPNNADLIPIEDEFESEDEENE